MLLTYKCIGNNLLNDNPLKGASLHNEYFSFDTLQYLLQVKFYYLCFRQILNMGHLPNGVLLYQAIFAFIEYFPQLPIYRFIYLD